MPPIISEVLAVPMQTKTARREAGPEVMLFIVITHVHHHRTTPHHHITTAPRHTTPHINVYTYNLQKTRGVISHI